ncbi:MAG: hypothetical protein U1E83_01080 [Methylotetracoccus sp.]
MSRVHARVLKPFDLYGVQVEPGDEPVELDAVDCAWAAKHGLVEPISEPAKPKKKQDEQPV